MNDIPLREYQVELSKSSISTGQTSFKYEIAHVVSVIDGALYFEEFVDPGDGIESTIVAIYARDSWIRVADLGIPHKEEA